MDTDLFVLVGHRALELALLVSLPPVLVALVAGVISGVFQAVTQVQDSTLSSVPRLLASVGTLVLTGHWAGEQVRRLTIEVLTSLPEIVP